MLNSPSHHDKAGCRFLPVTAEFVGDFCAAGCIVCAVRSRVIATKSLFHCL